MDEIIVQPAVHQAVGGLALLLALITSVLTWRGARRQEFGRAQAVALIALQIMLMLQALVGIKLLDQGMGVMQKVVHYLGGLGAVGLLMLFYWLPQHDAKIRSRNAAYLSTAALTFVGMTFFIGQMYVKSLN